MMNAGLSALMPGQAAPNMAGVLPPPSQAAPDAVPSKVDALARLPFEQLQAMYRNPPKGVPAYAIIAARDKQIKAEQMRQAQQGLMAQQQVARQQGTVADNVMGMDTVYAANGGEMRVQSFQSGGNPQVERILKKSPQSRTSEENKILEDAGIKLERRTLPTDSGISRFDRWLASPFIREAITDGALFLSDEELAKRTDTAATNEKIARTFGAKPAPVETLPEPVERSELDPALRAIRDIRPLPPQTPPPAEAGLRAGADALAGAGRTPPPAATQRQRQQQSQVPTFDINELTRAINATGVIPPEILEERNALAAARKAQLERQQAAAKRYEAVLEESPEDRRMRAFAAIAKGLSSSPRLSKGLSAALSELVGSETEARRARREGMKEVMTLEDAAANLQIAMQQQALADATGDNKLKTAAALARAQALRDFQKATIEQIRQQQLADAESKRAEAALIAAGKTGSSDSSLRAQQRLALQSQITALEDRAKDLARPEAERRAAEQQAAKLRRRMNALLELETGSGATEPTAGTQYDFDLATGKLVPRAQ